MNSIKQHNLLVVVPLLFILFSSLLGTASSNVNYILIKPYTVPSFISNVSYYCYITMIVLLSAYGLIRLYNSSRIPVAIVLMAIPYTILLIWSIVTMSDIFRYLVLLVSILLCPIGIAGIISYTNTRLLANLLSLLLLALLLISGVYSLLNFPTSPRVSGHLNNPNLMGIWIVSTLIVILVFKNQIKPMVFWLYIILSIILVILTGSRLGFILTVIATLPLIKTYRKKIFLLLLFTTPFLFFLDQEINFRVFEVSDAVSDSGRSVFWQRAINCIQQQPLLGYGMEGQISCVGTGNVHNSYLRIAVMIGIPLAIVFYSLYYISIFRFYKTSKNYYIGVYFLILPFSLFGEDYIAGFASPFFAFMVFIIALYINDQKYNNPSRR